jgi:DNA (cytosine-5)-methyltransferase 1
MKQLVLSLFPGADLFGLAFEIEGFCVVKGPDILFGGDIRRFSPPKGRFDGIIGGPPCKVFSDAVEGQVANTVNLIPEFTRVVREAEPKWWVMENVVGAFAPELPDWKRIIFDAWDVGANQHRTRSFWSNLVLEITKVDKRTPDPWPTVLATEHKYSAGSKDRRRAGRKVGRRMTIEEVNEAMGLPRDFSTPALNTPMQYEVRGNGVPLPMGRAIAKSVKKSYYDTQNAEGLPETGKAAAV